jgi:bifunctional DNase/RNase
MKEVEVFSVRVEVPGNQPIVLLREISGDHYLPIWVGPNEASVIALAQQGVQSVRPLTHDLITKLLEQFQLTLTMVRITELVDGVFHAQMCFQEGSEISCRPSDAIALALKANVPIFCAEEVISAAGIVVDEGGDSEAEVEAFREFLDQIKPEDFT